MVTIEKVVASGIEDLGQESLSRLFDVLHANQMTTVLLDVSSIRSIRVAIGDPACFGTTGYWIVQYAMHSARLERSDPRLGRNLKEEVVACLLGGFGIPAEMALAAFATIRDAGLLDEGRGPDEESILAALSAVQCPDGRARRYRFAKQRASRIHQAISMVDRADGIPTQPLELRKWLLRIPGVGPKTASWVVRNWTRSCEVAVLDIHVVRAGRKAGWFPLEWDVQHDYGVVEEAFLSVCRQFGMAAERLDTIIWEQMRKGGSAVL